MSTSPLISTPLPRYSALDRLSIPSPPPRYSSWTAQFPDHGSQGQDWGATPVSALTDDLSPESSQPSTPMLQSRHRMGKAECGLRRNKRSYTLGYCQKADQKIPNTLSSGSVKGFAPKAPEKSLSPAGRTYRSFMSRCESSQFKAGILFNDDWRDSATKLLAQVWDTKFVQKRVGSTCIVVPCVFKEEWVSGLREIAPSFSIVDHHGRRRDQNPQILERCDLAVVTHETLLSEWKNWNNNAPRNSAIFRAQFLRIVIAEGDSIVNSNLQRTKACMDLKGEYRWIVANQHYTGIATQIDSFLKFLRIDPKSPARSSFDRVKAFKTLLEMRSEPLPRRGCTLDSFARPMGVTMKEKEASIFHKEEFTSVIGEAKPGISTSRYLVPQLHEEPEETMDLDYPEKERGLESRAFDFTEVIRTAGHKRGTDNWNGKVSGRNVLGLVPVTRKENLLLPGA